ncbi:MAG TPA: XRE family transcriptional regulator [Nitrospirae bacterium]|nr:XRE family transcriptional regulator [Nitrospirota bacterium]
MIKKIRKLIKDDIDSGTKQITLARGIGLSQSSIQKILYTDTKPTVETVKKIAAYYNVLVADLITDNIEDVGRVSEKESLYLDDITDKVVLLMKGMPEEKRRDILKYAEKEKLLEDLLKKQRKRTG